MCSNLVGQSPKVMVVVELLTGPIASCRPTRETLNKMSNKNPAIAEIAARTACLKYPCRLQHADNGYSRRGSFDGSLVHNMFSIFAR